MFDWLVVGLGNPGDKYSRTRHNIGWMVAEKLAIKHSLVFKSSLIYHTCELKLKKSNILICMPTTYMNASGEAVRKLAHKYQIPIEKVIVIVDEYNFPVGKIHIKQGGSDGGHNGISSIIEEMKSDRFVRLRCGIGKEFQAGGMADYVLSNFPDSQSDIVNDMISKSIDSIEYLVNNDFSRAMSFVNSGKLWQETIKKEGNKNDQI